MTDTPKPAGCQTASMGCLLMLIGFVGIPVIGIAVMLIAGN